MRIRDLRQSWLTPGVYCNDDKEMKSEDQASRAPNWVSDFRETLAELEAWNISSVSCLSWCRLCWLNTCSSMELILSTSQSMRNRFSCRRSISSMMRLYSVGSTMFPTERAVTCQLLATADSMIAWRMVKPGGAGREEVHYTRVVLEYNNDQSDLHQLLLVL